MQYNDASNNNNMDIKLLLYNHRSKPNISKAGKNSQVKLYHVNKQIILSNTVNNYSQP